MLVLRTPKGWTGPHEVDGVPVEGTWRSHQVPLAGLAEKPEHLRHLERWMRSYRPEELFIDGAPDPKPLRETGRQLGLSAERVRQLESKALERLATRREIDALREAA